MYIFHEDAGHGWLAVPIKEVIESGIEVSKYSYRNGDMAYLEEDLDADLFFKAAIQDDNSVTPVWDGDYSPIRNYARY